MKKNNLVIVIVVIIILAVAGWWYFGRNNGAMNPGGMMSDGITDLFGQNVSMTCTYTDEEGRSATTHIKNGAVRSDYTGATAEETGSMILKDKVVYTWQGNEGMKMTIPDVTITPVENEPVADEQANEAEIKAELEKYKESCKNAVLSDDLFTPPADVTFTDYSQMMEESKQMMQEQSGMSEEQIQQYMQQYAPAQ